MLLYELFYVAPGRQLLTAEVSGVSNSCCPVTHSVSHTTPEQFPGTAGVMRAEQGEIINSYEEKLYLNSQTNYVPMFFLTISEHLTFTFCMLSARQLFYLIIILVPIFTKNEVYS